MIVDTSAVIAILELEPEAADFAGLIAKADTPWISAVAVVEAGMLAESRRGPAGADELDRFLVRAKFRIIPFDHVQARIARQAFRRYGKGRHPASLNFGDCIAYSLSKASGKPLLFKGNDFGKTDVITCLPTSPLPVQDEPIA